MLTEFFSEKNPIVVPGQTIPIYFPGEIPNLEDYEEMSGYAIDAYPDRFGRNDGAEDAMKLAVTTVAAHFDITPEEALGRFEICIVPGIGYHGYILAKRKD